MEIVLSRYSNFLFGWRDTVFKISIDAFSYSDTSTPDQTIYHFNELQYGFINKDEKSRDCFLIPIKTKEMIYIMSLETTHDGTQSSDFLLFCNYFNYHKYAFLLNMECKGFIAAEQYKLNTKEIVLSLNMYSGISYHKEILLNLGNNLVLIKTIFEATTKKINLIKDALLHSCNGISSDLINFSGEISDIYPDMPLDNESYPKQKENGFYLNSIDRVREVYLALCRILFELRRSLAERRINSKSKFGNKLDIISRFTFAKGNPQQLEAHFKKNSELKQIRSNALEVNKQYRKQLKDLINNGPFNLHFCFKCGNLLTITEDMSATCLFDDDCRHNSILYCKRCGISYCTYCILYQKTINCGKSHLLKATLSSNQIESSIKDQSCSLCHKVMNLNVIGYSCDECHVRVCPSCYEDIQMNEKQPKCSCGRKLFWRRGYFKFCKKCHKETDCFWYCFLCRLYFCAFCNQTRKDVCGGGHKMKEINADAFVKENTDLHKAVLIDKILNPKLNQLLQGVNYPFDSNCSVCQSKCCITFNYCSRCSFVKCMKCNSA